ncbi:MAG: helix-turn-helix domain-containing protein [Lachnospiraceae bacterium]|nr:helix-turn-helix domain-containing protein [Lachnospiraceae bacterium]
MEIYKILAQIMEERQLKISDVARMCDLPDSTVRGIEKRKQSTIALEVAFKLSNGLGVSLEYLNGMPEKNNNSENDFRLKKITNYYNEMDDIGKNQLVDQAEYIKSKHPRHTLEIKAAHNDHETEPGELEKMRKDLSKLKKPD